jgi:hypothetical protein
MSQSPQSIIEQAWENRANLSPEAVSGEIRNAVNAVLEGLNTGSIRVAERRSVGKWEVNQWVKKAVLLSFRLEDNKPMGAGGYTQFYDKVPSKFEHYTAQDFANGGFRVVPPAMTLLTLVWLYIENQPEEKIANHARYTFWYVIPTLPMFLLFPYLLPKLGFWMTMGVCVIATVVCFGLFAQVMKSFGINLL